MTTRALKLSSPLGKGWSLGKEYVPRTICEWCSKQFYAPPVLKRRGGGKFCSRACYAQKKISDPKDRAIKSCPVCKTEFAVHRCHEDRTKYCSKDCATRAQLTRSPVPTKERLSSCPTCKNDFRNPTGTKTYCSAECYSESNKGPGNWNYKGGPKPDVCLACGKTYLVKPASHGLVCSLKCWASIRTKIVPGTPQPRGKGGKRADLGGCYFRSTWEANWARYLNWLQSKGQIAAWQYEPDTFEFKKIRKGTRFYTPDFSVLQNNGELEYHEVKGWMTKESQTKLKRMKKYFPDIKIKLIDGNAYRSISRQLKNSLPHWEVNARKGY